LNRFSKYVFFLALLNLLIALAGQVFISITAEHFDMSSLLGLLAAFSLISVITVLIFLRGRSKDPQSQTMHTMVAMSLKFLLDLIAALLWFVVAKKNSTSFLLMFFVLYLTFTLFSVIYILKTLKNKPL
jgi:hypothetical protein